MAFGQCTRPSLFLHYYTLHALDLSQKAQGRGSKYCIVMPERNRYGAGACSRRMVQGPKPVRTKNLGGDGDEHSVIV
jgi:hypothetical protein